MPNAASRRTPAISSGPRSPACSCASRSWRGNDDPEVREEAEAALDQSARLLSIIEELLALAAYGPGRQRLAVSTSATSSASTSSDVEPILARAGRRAVVVAPKPVPVLATLGAVGQALDILLSNAVRHGAGRVTATVSADERRARVDITDEGRGHHRPRRATRCSSRRADGTGHGIGLALAHTLVTTEGGTIALLAAVAAGVPGRAPAGLTESLPERWRSPTRFSVGWSAKLGNVGFARAGCGNPQFLLPALTR